MPKIIMVVGLPGSGKSTVTDYISDRFGADVFLSGDIIREEVKRRNLAYTPENDAKVAHWFHTGGRENLVIKRLWVKMRKSRKSILVVDGLRCEKQFRYLQRTSKTRPVVISVEASQDVRVKRELSRGRFGRKESLAYVKFRDRLEKSHGILGLMRMADYRIDNTRLSVRQSEARICEIIKEILAN
jgi:dephospho-CoA kinase